MKTKRYKLLKDLPNLKAGEIVEGPIYNAYPDWFQPLDEPTLWDEFRLGYSTRSPEADIKWLQTKLREELEELKIQHGENFTPWEKEQFNRRIDELIKKLTL